MSSYLDGLLSPTVNPVSSTSAGIVPATGGQTGKALKVQGDGSTDWETIEAGSSLPIDGSTGQVLARDSMGNGEWIDPWQPAYAMTWSTAVAASGLTHWDVDLSNFTHNGVVICAIYDGDPSGYGGMIEYSYLVTFDPYRNGSVGDFAVTRTMGHCIAPDISFPVGNMCRFTWINTTGDTHYILAEVSTKTGG